MINLIVSVVIVLSSSALFAADIPLEMHTDPIKLHGFDRVHARGIRGAGQTISMIEGMNEMVAKQLPDAFQSKDIKVFDCSCSSYCLKGSIDSSSYRYPPNLRSPYFNFPIFKTDERMQQETSDYKDHVIQTTSLALGMNGAAPDACGKGFHITCMYTSGLLDYHKYERCGSALFTYSEMLQHAYDHQVLYGMEKWGDNKESILQNWHKEIENSPFKEQLTEKTINPGVLDAVRHGASKQRSILNLSMRLTSLCDPFDDFRVPARILDHIAETLEATDSILVMAAANFGDDVEGQAKGIQKYLQSFSQHERLKKRILIVINLEEHDKKPNFERDLRNILPVKIAVFNGIKKYVKPHFSSNIPLDHGWDECAISAFGTNILFPGGVKSLGTSLATPLVSGGCALVWEAHPQFSGPQVIQHIKDTAIPVGDIKIYGHGLINPPRACGIPDYDWDCGLFANCTIM